MDLFLSLQCRAMLGVVKPTRESWYRHVMRWYSKTFHTPLHEVQDLPLEDVVLAYYEEAFEQMEEEDREEQLERLVETDEEREAREKADTEAEKASDDFFEALNQQIEEDVKRGTAMPKLRKRRKEKLPGKLTSFSADAEAVSGNRSLPPKSVTAAPVPPEPVSNVPLIDMAFDEEPPGSNLQDSPWDLSADPLGSTRKKKT